VGLWGTIVEEHHLAILLAAARGTKADGSASGSHVQYRVCAVQPQGSELTYFRIAEGEGGAAMPASPYDCYRAVFLELCRD
jgi:hypothetical protein